MADEFNNINEQTNTTTDEVVDDIPENAQNINENTQKAYSSTSTTTSRDNSFTSILSLALGIFSVICCCTTFPAVISAVIGLVMGILSLRDKSNINKTFAIIGIILCSIGLAIFIIMCAVAIIFGSINTVIEIPATMHSRMM